MIKWEEDYKGMNDNELYHEIRPLFFDENDFTGFFFRGHVDMEQWRKVATEYLKNEYEIEASRYTTFKKGWYKILPNRTMKLLNGQVRGSFAAMECIHD